MNSDRSCLYHAARNEWPVCHDKRSAGVGPVSRHPAKRPAWACAFEPIEKWEFYKHVNTTDHVLTIQTADQHLFANSPSVWRLESGKVMSDK